MKNKSIQQVTFMCLVVERTELFFLRMGPLNNGNFQTRGFKLIIKIDRDARIVKLTSRPISNRTLKKIRAKKAIREGKL